MSSRVPGRQFRIESFAKDNVEVGSCRVSCNVMLKLYPTKIGSGGSLDAKIGPPDQFRDSNNYRCSRVVTDRYCLARSSSRNGRAGAGLISVNSTPPVMVIQFCNSTEATVNSIKSVVINGSNHRRAQQQNNE